MYIYIYIYICMYVYIYVCVYTYICMYSAGCTHRATEPDARVKVRMHEPYQAEHCMLCKRVRRGTTKTDPTGSENKTDPTGSGASRSAGASRRTSYAPRSFGRASSTAAPPGASRGAARCTRAPARCGMGIEHICTERHGLAGCNTRRTTCTTQGAPCTPGSARCVRCQRMSTM